jgi:hypothetical protein
MLIKTRKALAAALVLAGAVMELLAICASGFEQEH